eukprot:m.154911 g.154911  ORF g.154911 m.154911 type:complete len:116 (+) comp11719_c0_seq16:4913-5260(+)
MAEAYAEQQGGTVWWAQPDGWCLLSCMARATGGDRVLLLQQALQMVADCSVPTTGPEQLTAAPACGAAFAKAAECPGGDVVGFRGLGCPADGTVPRGQPTTARAVGQRAGGPDGD